eukprot:TRINITY_DN3139_c0_g1_i1.p1 TRINITY_DN3139_c0_g1~~TRINITY_DN3139_c0_g1_i1.p1  ORF type:complete len:239 (-),score=59.70 TRINITY_DN3139_c0_g1_i1:137-853(-)
MSEKEQEKPKWTPLESNPEIMTKFIHSLGVSKNWAFNDCYGLGDEELSWVPRPCLAVLLLFPWEQMKEEKKKQLEKIVKEGQVVSPKVFYMKQIVQNACGTIAVMHSIANNTEKLNLNVQNPQSPIERFLAHVLPLTTEDRGWALGKNPDIHKAHSVVSKEGQTKPPGEHDDVDYHFIAFTEIDGNLYELDGAKKFPINHGPTSPETLLKDAAHIIKQQFMDKVPNSSGFSVITLGPA